MNRLGVIAQATALAILTAGAGWWFVGVFVSGSVALPLVLMVVTVTATLVGIHLIRVPSLLVDLLVGTVCVAAVLFVVAVVRSAQPTVDLLEGLVNGWARVLTTELPVAGRMDLLVAPLVVIGLATVVGVVALLRSRSAWLPMAPLLVIVALGLAFGDGAASQPWAVVAGLVGGSCALALLRSSLPVSEASLDGRVDDEPTLVMPSLGGIAALIGAVGLAVMLTGPTPVRNESEPFTLRRYVTPDQEDLRLVSPLSRAEELADVDRVMTIKAVNAVPAGTRVRVASLDTYDGLGWSPTERLQPVGSKVSSLSPSGTNLDLVVTPHNLGLPWIPTVGEPTKVSAEGDGPGTVLLWSPISGNLATSDLAASDGTAWRVNGVVPAPSADQLAMGRLSPGLPLNLGERDLNDDVKKLRDQAQQIVGADPGSFAAAARLLNLFKNKSDDPGDSFAVDPEAASSPALGSVIRFMEGRVGNRFQFATSYATVAQLGGIPARVVVGTKIEEGVPQGSTVEVSGADLTAWPEVNISGLGWTALDPVPDEEGSASGAAEEQLDEAVDEAISSDPKEPPPPDDQTLDPDANTKPQSNATSKIWIILVGLLALLLGLVASPAIRFARRRKRRSGTPSQCTAGAWAELMDVFVEEGQQRPLSATPSETSRLLSSSVDESGGTALSQLTGLVEQSVFSRTEPSQADADQAWVLLRDVRKGLSRSPLQSLRATLAPAPLLGDSPRGIANTESGTVSNVVH